MILQVCWRWMGYGWSAVIFGDYHRYDLIEPMREDYSTVNKAKTSWDW